MVDADRTELLTGFDVRAVNDWIQDASRWLGSLQLVERYRCECGDASCERTIGLTDAEYEWVRADSTHFVVALNHEHPAEHVVAERQRLAVVGTVEAWASSAASGSRHSDGLTCVAP